jgi:hypothetical protein
MIGVSDTVSGLLRTGGRPLAARGAFSHRGSLSKPSLALIADISTCCAPETVMVTLAALNKLVTARA